MGRVRRALPVLALAAAILVGTALAPGCNKFAGGPQDGSALPFVDAGQVLSLGAADNTGFAVTSTGVWGWGDNRSRLLADGMPLWRDTPGLVPGMSEVIDVAAVCTGGLALKSDGRVWAWGNTFLGDVPFSPTPIHLPGLGDAISYLPPCTVAGLSGVKAIAAENGGGYALTEDGSLWAWGRQERGGRETPVAVPVEGVPKFDFLGQGFAATAGGELWVWDANGTGCSPAKVSEVSSAAEASGDSTFLYAVLDASGKVWDVDCATGGAPAVRGVPGLADVATLSHFVIGCFALKNDGTVWVWGQGYSGIFGIGGKECLSLVPLQVGGLPEITDLATGWSTCYALADTGEVWAWGGDESGQLGLGALGCSNKPVQLVGLGDAVSVAGASNWAAAVKKDGTVWMWGSEWAVLLPAVEAGENVVPVQVPGLPQVERIVPANQTAYALATDGSVWVWGYTGLHPDVWVEKPMPVPGVSGVVSVAGSGWNGYAVTADGVLLGWGSNEEGQLGLPASDEFVPPSAIGGLPKIEAVAAGY